MRLKLAIWLGLGLYALLSITDWMMTYTLLRMHPGAVESNPLAAACLERYGWDGLAFYKAGGVLVFVGAIGLLIRRRPPVAAGVVALGCAALLWVTAYTHTLIIDAHRENAALAADAAWVKPRNRPAAKSSPVPEQCWFAHSQPIPTATVRK